MKSTGYRFAAPLWVAAGLSMASPLQARASDITFAVIGPHEYELPVNYDAFNAVVQYGEINANNQVYNNQGHIQNNTTGGDLYEGLTKYVYFFDFKQVPNVGFAAEVIEPEVRISDVTPSEDGLAGTIFGFAGWFKPNIDSTLGFQSFGQAPDGTSNLNHGASWNNLSSILFDYQFKHFDIDGDAGIVFRFNSRYKNEFDHALSDLYHVNFRLGFKVHPIVEPFLAVDWSTANPDKNLFTGQELVDSAYQETAVGGGLNFALTKKIGFTVRYSRGVEGRNTTVTNAGYFKFYIVF